MKAGTRRSILSPAGLFTFGLLRRTARRVSPTVLARSPGELGLERLVTVFMNRPSPSVTDPWIQKDTAMTQWIFAWGMVLALVGLILVLVLDILLDLLGDDDHTHDKRQGLASPNQRDGFERHIAHPGSQRSRPDKGT